MENGPFIDDFPIKTSIFNGFSMAMLNNQMVKGYLMGCCGIWDLVGDFTRLKNGIQLELMGFFWISWDNHQPSYKCGEQPAKYEKIWGAGHVSLGWNGKGKTSGKIQRIYA